MSFILNDQEEIHPRHGNLQQQYPFYCDFCPVLLLPVNSKTKSPDWHASLFFPMLCVLWMSSPTHLWQLSCRCCDSIVRSPWASSCACWTLPAFPASLISVLSTAEVSPVWAEGRDHLPWSAGDAPPNVLHLSLLNLVRDLLAFWDPSGCQHSPLVPTTGALKCQHWRNLPYCSPSN